MGARCHQPAPRRKWFPAAAALLEASALVWIALASGCAPVADLQHLDTSVTAANLRQGKIAVLGVVKFQEPDQVRPPLIAMLEKTFREERRDVPLIPADSVRQILGAERDRKLLLAYEYQGALDPAALAEISDSLRGTARFLLLARVDRDRTRNSTRGIALTDTTSSAHVLYAMGVTGRDARVTVQIYDLSRRALAVSARYEGSTESEHPMLSPMGQVNFLPKVPPEEQGYPETPELALALEEPFRTFARTLPGAPAAAPAR
jgi:hypothetical protein